VNGLKKNLAYIADHDHIDELIAIPTIGKSIANVIIEYVNTGSSQFLNRINGQHHVENVFDEIPGIGPHLSHLISSRLNIKTLDQLQKAFEDGRLAKIPGIGPKRLSLVEMVLNNLLLNRDDRDAKIIPIDTPQVDVILAPEVSVILRLDYLYRNKAEIGELHKLKPRKFNPNQRAWLPIYHKELNGWHFTCLYSNTARAHKMKMTKDWVVISYEKDGIEGQCTIVTEIQGELNGQRVIRGREEECLKFYKSKLVKEF